MSQQKYSLLYPDTNAQYRTLSDATMHDLGMDQICKKLSAKEREQNYIQNVMARLYADPAVTQYRCDIFEDVLQQKKMRDDLMEILERISFLRDYGSFNREYDESACIWDLLHRLDELNDYIKCVDALHTCLAASDIHSAGFLGLKAYVEKIYADNGFAELKKDISELKMDTSQLKSITVGINLNDRFEADGIGLISVNSKYFTKSGILGNFYDHIASKDRINEDTIWKKNFKFQPFDVNADAVSNTHDAFICQLSTNDASNAIPLGEISSSRNLEDFDTKTVLGALEYIIVYADTTWHCPVVFYTGTQYDSPAYGKMVEQLLKLQEKYEIGVIDLWNDAEMNQVSEEDYKLYMFDGIHPTQAGYLNWWIPKMEAYLYDYLGQ